MAVLPLHPLAHLQQFLTRVRMCVCVCVCVCVWACVYLALGKSAEICVAIKKLAKSGKSGTSGVGRIFFKKNVSKAQ